MTGGDALPTLRTEFHRLRAGATTSTQRSTGSSVWQVFRGQGTAELAGNRFELAEGDLITVPSWAPLRFVADTELDLFTFNDHRLFEVLNLYRTALDKTAVTEPGRPS
jgi:gentisate 1,2-dioxygenase